MSLMNYREKIRKAISCPQFGDNCYGEWGALRLDQRKLIKRLLDELENNQLYCFKSEKDELQQRIDKAIEYIKENSEPFENKLVSGEYFEISDLLEILGEKENVSEEELFEYLRTHFLVLGDYTIKYNGEKWDTITGRTESWTVTRTLPIFENEENKNEEV